jgi:hypothetical protein
MGKRGAERIQLGPVANGENATLDAREISR